jgi:hypothetical protein
MDSRVELNAVKLSKPALRGTPITWIDERRGPDHAQEWRATCLLGNHPLQGSFWHTTKDDARKDAASRMTEYIRLAVCPLAIGRRSNSSADGLQY